MDHDHYIPGLDLCQISHKCIAWMRYMVEILWRVLTNQYPPILRVLFSFCDIFVKYISTKMFIFIWIIMDYLFIVKIVVVSSPQVKCSMPLPHDIIVNDLWCYNVYVTLCMQLCDVTICWWCCHWYQTIINYNMTKSCDLSHKIQKT